MGEPQNQKKSVLTTIMSPGAWKQRIIKRGQELTSQVHRFVLWYRWISLRRKYGWKKTRYRAQVRAFKRH